MSPPGQRRGVMNLRTVGRAFWIGLAASLALHAFFLAKGKFPQAKLDSSPPLEARLEPEEFDAVKLPEPEPASEAPAPATDDTPPPRAPAPAPAEAAASVSPAPMMLPMDEPSIAPASPAPPLPKAEPPPPSAQPHAILTQAAQRIRSLPAHVEIVYELKGMLSGRQVHTWQQSGQRYTLETVAEATGLTSLFVGGRMTQKSSGRIGALGLMPERYEIQRASGKKEVLEFDYADNLIKSSRTDAKRGTRTLDLPLLTGAQDPLSSIYQLAMAAQGGSDGLIVAASSKKVKGYLYRMLGTEILRTPLGEMKTLHVTRAGDSGKDDTHLWLAPERYALPVKVSYLDEEGTEWVLEAVSISTR